MVSSIEQSFHVEREPTGDVPSSLARQHLTLGTTTSLDLNNIHTTTLLIRLILVPRRFWIPPASRQIEIKPVLSIYQEEITKLRDDEWDADSKEIVQKLPTFYSSKSTLYRARRKQTPKLPASSIDIQLDGKWTETFTGERFLLFDDTQQQQRIIAFCSYWKLDRPLSIWSHLLWWNLLYLSFSLPSDIHHSHERVNRSTHDSSILSREL